MVSSHPEGHRGPFLALQSGSLVKQQKHRFSTSVEYKREKIWKKAFCIDVILFLFLLHPARTRQEAASAMVRNETQQQLQSEPNVAVESKKCHGRIVLIFIQKLLSPDKYKSENSGWERMG